MNGIAITADDFTVRQRSLERIINGPETRIKDSLQRLGDRYKDPAVQASLDSIFCCFSVVDILYNLLAPGRILDKKLSVVLSTYVGADYGLHVLDGNGGGKIKSNVRNVFENQRMDFEKYYPLPRDELLVVYSSFLDKYANMGLSSLTGQFFNWMKDEAITEGERYPHSKNTIDAINGKILDDYKFKGMSARISRIEEKSEDYTWKNFAGYSYVADYFKDFQLLIKNFDYCMKLKTLDTKNLLPKGTLLYGPPGTGKTRIARTFCNESGIPFDIFSVSEVGSSYVNETSIKVRNKFDDAAKYIRTGESKFSLLFIDEIDSLGKSREGSTNGGKEDNKAVETMQMCMDGHLAVPGVIVIGATNRPNDMDRSLIRPGRISEWQYMGELDKGDARKVFSLYTTTGCKEIDIESLLNRYYTAPEPDPLNVPRQIRWTPAFVEEITVKAKRRKLIEHLKDRSKDYLVSNADLEQEIKAYR